MRSSAGRSGKRRPVVTYVIAGYPPRIGGAEIQAHRVARLLVPDFEVRVLTGQVNGYPARETIDGVQVRRIPLRDRSAPGEQPTDEGGLTTALLDALVAAGYGLVGPRPSVIQGFQMNGLTFGAAALAEVRRVPLITTLTGNVVVERLTAGGKLGRGKLALLGRASHAVVAVSRSVYRTAARAGIPEAKLRTVPNGVDTSYFCPPDGEARCHARAELGYEPDDFVFCWVGRLDPIKGLSQLLDAWGRVEHLRPRARLLIVGDGEDRSTAEELVRRYPRSVRRLSFQENVRPVYHASDAFLMTSFSEGLSCTLLEAMASGLPVVVSALEENLEVGGGAEFMTTFPSRSPAALEHALLSMIDSRDRGPGLGLEARRRAEDFSLEVTARLWAELYRQLG